MKVFVTVAVVAASACVANAHTYLTQPLAEFKAGASKSSWVDQFSPPWSGKFKTGAEYAAVAPSKGFKDLRSFLESKGPECGNTLPNATPKPIPSDGMVKFASTLEHPGPCEFWCDSLMVYHNDDCEKTFGSSTSVKIDFSKCGGTILRFYWLGLQDSGTRWQSYKNCVPLAGGKSGGSSESKTNGNSGGNAGRNTGGNEAGNDAGTSNGKSSGKSSDKSSKSDKSSGNSEGKSSTKSSDKSITKSDKSSFKQRSMDEDEEPHESFAMYNETAREDANEYTFANLNDA